MPDTVPSAADNDGVAVQVEPFVTDSRTGAMWVHKDLVNVRKDWELGPPRVEEAFGDVESWAAYVKRFAGVGEFEPMVTWNAVGFRATLDYHSSTEDAGRMQWNATLPFLKSAEWMAWMALCTGHAIRHRDAVEKIEDLSVDVTDPDPAALMSLLRSLRATVNATAQTELLPDGTTRIGFSQDKAVKGIGNDMTLPPEFTIAIPILKGVSVRYKLAVRLRASVDDNAHLTLRFSIPLAEQALEAVYADQVAAAKLALGDSISVLRAAG